MRRLTRLGMTIAVLVALTATVPAAQGRQGRGAAPASPEPPTAPGGCGGPPTRGGGMLAGAGPADKPVVDPAAADRGRSVYAAQCIQCHGTQARGNDNGPNLIRSVVVLRDRCGSELGPFLKRGHKTMSGTPSASLTTEQINDLTNFLRQRLNDSLRGSPIFQVQNVLTGDPKAGAAYFSGEGKCSTCHSATGNLAGIGGRYEPVDLQQRFLFPGGGRGGGARGRGAPPAASAVTVSVTQPSGESVSGVLVQMDDFNVSLRDASGLYRTFKRTAALKVVKTDPLDAHHTLLETITDKNIHDVVAYLETLK